MDKSTVKLQRRTAWAHDLLPSERRFLAAINELGFGRLELLRIRRGELILDPWPKTVRAVKFGSLVLPVHRALQDAFEIRAAVREFFDYVRGVDDGEILFLEVRHGLPFLMEIKHRPAINQSPTVERGDLE